MDYRNKDELFKGHKEVRHQFEDYWKTKNIDSLLNELHDLDLTSQEPTFWDNAEKARELSIKKSNLENKLTPWKTLRSEIVEFPELAAMTFEEVSDAKAAAESLSTDLNRLISTFEELLMADAMMGEDDDRNCIVNISPGAGGTESQDWAQMLYRMYTRWFEKKGYRTETLDYQDGEEAGLKSVTLLVKGQQVFGHLKSENGIHRLVRISPFDSNKRRHTSFAAVHITPEVDDDIDIQIEDKDIRVDTYRSSGAGGQHVNKTDSAIRITHLASGIVVQCQNERSQMKNKSTAMKMLKARLYEMEKEKMQENIESRSGEKKDVSWGHQIRSYVMHPYKLVKDLRTGYESSDVDRVMDGDLDPFVNAFLKRLVGLGSKETVSIADLD